MAKKRDFDDLARFWFSRTYAELNVNGFVEVRMFNKDDKSASRQFVRTEDEFVSAVLRNRDDNNVYFGVAERRKPGDGHKSNVSGATMLWAEVDYSKLGWDRQACAVLLHNLPYHIRPSACVDSGYGFHLYWFLDEPLTNQRQIEDANKVLCEFVSSDNIWNCDRILRVPGSYNHKYGKKKPCQIVWLYHWATHEPSALIDGVLEMDRVLYDGNWVTRKEAAAREKLTDGHAAKMAYEDRRKSTTSRHEAIWEVTKYGGGPGWHGIDEACTLYTCGRVCRGHDVELIVKDTLRNVKAVWARDASNEHWDWRAEEKNIRSKIARWEKKWPAIKAELDAAAKANKQKMKEAQRGKSGRLQRAG